MTNKLVLTLYRNPRDVVIGDLYLREEQILTDRRLMATTHPATLAASVFATNGKSFVFKSKKGEGEFAFPLETDELDALRSLLGDQDEANFMSYFATFSRFDFAHPLPFDTQADIHFRVACHHLPAKLLRVIPTEPAPKSFKKELKTRNNFVYFPFC